MDIKEAEHQDPTKMENNVEIVEWIEAYDNYPQ